MGLGFGFWDLWLLGFGMMGGLLLMVVWLWYGWYRFVMVMVLVVGLWVVGLW